MDKIKDLLLHCDCGDKKCRSLLITDYYDDFIEVTMCFKKDNYPVLLKKNQVIKLLKFLKEFK